MKYRILCVFVLLSFAGCAGFSSRYGEKPIDVIVQRDEIKVSALCELVANKCGVRVVLDNSALPYKDELVHTAFSANRSGREMLTLGLPSALVPEEYSDNNLILVRARDVPRADTAPVNTGTASSAASTPVVISVTPAPSSTPSPVTTAAAPAASVNSGTLTATPPPTTPVAASAKKAIAYYFVATGTARPSGSLLRSDVKDVDGNYFPDAASMDLCCQDNVQGIVDNLQNGAWMETRVKTRFEHGNFVALENGDFYVAVDFIRKYFTIRSGDTLFWEGPPRWNKKPLEMVIRSLPADLSSAGGTTAPPSSATPPSSGGTGGSTTAPPPSPSLSPEASPAGGASTSPVGTGSAPR